MGSRGSGQPFLGDTATRGSQTVPVVICHLGTDTNPIEPNLKKASKIPLKRYPGLTPIPSSALVDKDLNAQFEQNAPKKRRTIPFSDKECIPPPLVADPNEFNLAGFAFTALPDPHQDYDRFNNDLVIEHYRPSARSYSGAQRKGIFEPFPLAQSYIEHINEALQAPFPLAELTPLPADLLSALKFHRDNSRETIREFQTAQLKQLRIIAEECRADTERWYRFTPEELKPNTGTIHIALLAHLARFTRLRGTNWLMQFVVGFPITGNLKQEGVFPLGSDGQTSILDPESLQRSKTSRFKARAPRSIPRSAQELWDEAMQQVSKNWLCPPEPLDGNGNFLNNPTSPINIAFRFGVPQSDKLRGCDDFKDALTNKCCHIATPITLPGWDHIAAASKTLSTRELAWAFGKIDHEAAYKALPLRPDDSRHAIIALYNPSLRGWFGFRSRTLLFGSTAAVLHYNCLSRIIASLACRLLLIPTIGYFDDFGFLVSALDSASAMSAFSELFSILGLSLKTAKSEIGTHITFLGLAARFPAPANHMTLSLSLSPDKARKWASGIETLIREGSVSHMALESLIGRLGFAQSSVFGRFARAMMKPLYTKLYAQRYSATLDPTLIRTLAWWVATLRNILPRVISFERSKPDWVIYTDASFEPGPVGGHIAAIFFRIAPQSAALNAELVLSSQPSVEEISFFASTSTIFGLELSAIVLALFRSRATLRNRAVVIYTDNNAALAALINGDSSSKAAFALIAIFWFIAASYNIAVWLERVDTKRNIADLPTRGVSLPFPFKERANFPLLGEALNFYEQQIAVNAPSLEYLSLPTALNVKVMEEE